MLVARQLGSSLVWPFECGGEIVEFCGFLMMSSSVDETQSPGSLQPKVGISAYATYLSVSFGAVWAVRNAVATRNGLRMKLWCWMGLAPFCFVTFEFFVWWSARPAALFCFANRIISLRHVPKWPSLHRSCCSKCTSADFSKNSQTLARLRRLRLAFSQLYLQPQHPLSLAIKELNFNHEW